MYNRRNFLSVAGALVGTTALAGCSGGSILNPPTPLVPSDVAEDINLVVNGLGMVMGLVQRFVSADVFATMQSYYSKAVSLVNSILSATQQGNLVQMARQLYDVVTSFLGVVPLGSSALAGITMAINIVLPIIMSSLGLSMSSARMAASPDRVAWARQTLRRR